MNTAESPNQIRRTLDSRLKQLMPRGPVLLASVVQSARRCGRYGCKCNRGERHVRTQITFKDRGKTRSIYVPADLVGEVRQWAAEGRRLQGLLKECSQLAVALLRSKPQAPQKLRRRPK
ncbi:MAG: hypothetical protein FJ290_06580 [Planctomycetes bacterium]|nr:hypothetical protein [Planctomycetota bacterium]